MISNVARSLAISTLLLGLCAACSSGDERNAGFTTPWLGTITGFERVSGEGEFGVFQNSTPGKTARFERGIILRPEIIISAGSDLEAIEPETYENIIALFRDALQAELATKVPTADADAPGRGATHAIQVALTGVTVTRTTNNSVAVRLSDLRFSFEGSTIEAEFRDVNSNAREAVIVVPATAGTIGWNALRNQLTLFARQTAGEAGKAYAAINARADKPADPAPKTP
jgi:hypothetical protein